MRFSFFKTTKSVAAMTVFGVAVSGPVAVTPAFGQDAAQQQQPAGGQQPASGQQKNFKDRAEYDLYVQSTKEQDAQKRLDLLKQWKDKYPQSDYNLERLTLTTAALFQTQQIPQGVDSAKELVKIDPKNLTGLFYISYFTPRMGASTPTPEVINQTQSAANTLLQETATKPANFSDADWAKQKDALISAAHTALGWSALMGPKDYAKAEQEFKESLKIAPNEGQVSYWLGQAMLAQKKPENYSETLFHFARAASYDGPGSIAAQGRTQISDYFKKIYAQYHGSEEGADKVLAQAKTTALPPADFKIASTVDVANQQAKAQQELLTQNPAPGLWVTLRSKLKEEGGAAYFDSSMKGAAIPGGANNVKYFEGTIISLEPETKPTKIVLGVEDAAKPDATIILDSALPGTMQPGEKLKFGGVAESFTAEPFMITFKSTKTDIDGWTGKASAAPAKRPSPGRRRR